MSKGDKVTVAVRLADKTYESVIVAMRNGQSIDIRRPDHKRGEKMLDVVILDKNKNDTAVYSFDDAAILFIVDERVDR